MDRRELLKMIAVLTGGAVVGGELLLSGCKTGAADTGFSATNIALLNEVGETIIPATDTPGAKAAQVGELMQVMITDCYTEKERAAFIKGIGELEAACKKANNKPFAECTPQQRHDFLVALEKEAKAFNEKKDAAEKAAREAAQKENKEFVGEPPHYYTMMKQLAIWGYFTSKIGVTQALRHVPVPGKYDGAYPYKKGEKAFS